MHYTEAFTQAFAPIQALLEEMGPAEDGSIPWEVRLAFRDMCISLGHLERVRNLYRVQAKLSRKAEFFVPNGPQETYLNVRKGRDIILKIRQVGFTTLSCIRALDYALWEPNMRTGIMAHQQNVVGTIFEDIVKFTYDWFKKDWGHLYAPAEKSDSSTTLAFKHDGFPEPYRRELNSSMRVLFDFRGKTVPFLHVSEASRIEPDRLLGSLQGVPANGEAILESTPNGRGGEFYRQWQNWRSMGTLAPYKGHFIPWYDYYPEEAGKWEIPTGSELTPYEKALLKEYPDKVTTAHLAWRRWCIEANCLGDPEKFENEYPTNDLDCWFSGENLVFGSSILKYQDSFVRPPSKIGFLLSDGAKLEFAPDPKGLVYLWQEPKPGVEYVAGADPSGGVGRDRAACTVINRATGEVVARIWGQLEPTEFAREILKLCRYYNKAWVCPETNNHGHVVIAYLTAQHYKNIYKRKVIDAVTNRPSSQYGFLTTNDSKLMLTERFKDACKDGRVRVYDNDLLTEMSTFVQLASKQGKSVRREATAGSHDDLLISACLAWEMNLNRGILQFSDEADSALDDDETSFDPDTGFALPW